MTASRSLTLELIVKCNEVSISSRNGHSLDFTAPRQLSLSPLLLIPPIVSSCCLTSVGVHRSGAPEPCLEKLMLIEGFLLSVRGNRRPPAVCLYGLTCSSHLPDTCQGPWEHFRCPSCHQVQFCPLPLPLHGSLLTHSYPGSSGPLFTASMGFHIGF